MQGRRQTGTSGPDIDLLHLDFDRRYTDRRQVVADHPATAVDTSHRQQAANLPAMAVDTNHPQQAANLPVMAVDTNHRQQAANLPVMAVDTSHPQRGANLRAMVVSLGRRPPRNPVPHRRAPPPVILTRDFLRAAPGHRRSDRPLNNTRAHARAALTATSVEVQSEPQALAAKRAAPVQIAREVNRDEAA
jgi:hypothetical protein